jgi:hypothetical protein
MFFVPDCKINPISKVGINGFIIELGFKKERLPKVGGPGLYPHIY